MKNVECRTQDELDAALRDPNVWPILVGDGRFEVSGNATVQAWDSATVQAWGSATVQASGSVTVRASGSATVRAWDSATVQASDSATVQAWGSATVQAWGSATVQASGSVTVRASDSATVRASGSATVRASGSATVQAWDSATVRAWGSATVRASDSATVRASDSVTVQASKYVAVTKSGGKVKATGGVHIDYLPPQNLAEWMEEYDIQVKDGVAIVYKAVDSNFKSQYGGEYSPGSQTECDHWDPSVECGGGLHVCGTPFHALSFYANAKRFVALPVAVDSIAHWPNGDYPTKVKVPRVVAPGCYEVDIDGKPVKAAK